MSQSGYWILKCDSCLGGVGTREAADTQIINWSIQNVIYGINKELMEMAVNVSVATPSNSYFPGSTIISGTWNGTFSRFNILEVGSIPSFTIGHRAIVYSWYSPELRAFSLEDTHLSRSFRCGLLVALLSPAARVCWVAGNCTVPRQDRLVSVQANGSTQFNLQPDLWIIGIQCVGIGPSSNNFLLILVTTPI